MTRTTKHAVGLARLGSGAVVFYLVAPQGGEREMNFFRVLLREITEEVNRDGRSV